MAQNGLTNGGLLRGLIVAVRPPEWIKNTFVFAAILFAGKLLDPHALTAVLISFVALCLAASATYLMNDVRDRAADRLHPIKRHRPIAAGIIPPGTAISVALGAAAAAIGLAFLVNRPTGLTLIGYLVLTSLYTVFLKHLVILDVLALAGGFVLRVILGAEAIQVEFSSWLILCTFMLAVFLGFAKRRHELILLEGQAQAHRPILGEYSAHFLDMMMGIVTASTLMSYVLYTMDPHTMEKFGSRNLIYTSVFVLYGIFRYLYLIHQRSSGGNPAQALYKDASLQLSVFLWVVTIVLMKYF